MSSGGECSLARVSPRPAASAARSTLAGTPSSAVAPTRAHAAAHAARSRLAGTPATSGYRAMIDRRWLLRPGREPPRQLVGEIDREDVGVRELEPPLALLDDARERDHAARRHPLVDAGPHVEPAHAARSPAGVRSIARAGPRPTGGRRANTIRDDATFATNVARAPSSQRGDVGERAGRREHRRSGAARTTADPRRSRAPSRRAARANAGPMPGSV